MIDDKEKENFQEELTILTLPRKINIKQVMTTERKSFSVYKSRIYMRKRHKSKWPNFEEKADERKNFPDNIAYL
jgi:inner membrane protein involved in colicin E2 resistance